MRRRLVIGQPRHRLLFPSAVHMHVRNILKRPSEQPDKPRVAVIDHRSAILRGIADHLRKVHLVADALLAGHDQTIDRLSIPFRFVAVAHRLPELAAQSLVVARPSALPVAQCEGSKANVDPAILCLWIKLNRLLGSDKGLLVSRLIDERHTQVRPSGRVLRVNLERPLERRFRFFVQVQFICRPPEVVPNLRVPAVYLQRPPVELIRHHLAVDHQVDIAQQVQRHRTVRRAFKHLKRDLGRAFVVTFLGEFARVTQNLVLLAQRHLSYRCHFSVVFREG